MAVKAIRLLVIKLLTIVLLVNSLDVYAGGPKRATITFKYGSLEEALKVVADSTEYIFWIAPEVAKKKFNFHLINVSLEYFLKTIRKKYGVEVLIFGNIIVIRPKRAIKGETQNAEIKSSGHPGKNHNLPRLIIPASVKTYRPVSRIFGKKELIPIVITDTQLVIDITDWMPHPFTDQQDIISLDNGIAEEDNDFYNVHTDIEHKKLIDQCAKEDLESVANDPPHFTDFDNITSLRIYHRAAQIFCSHNPRLVRADIDKSGPIPNFFILPLPAIFCGN